MKKLSRSSLLGLFVTVFIGLIYAESKNEERLTYKTGFAAIVRFGSDLYKALKPKFRPLVHSRPINVGTEDSPIIRLEEITDPAIGNSSASILISAGFIDLVNNVAHAKAIDKIEKGYFQKYIISLAQETGEKGLRELPGLSNPKYWTLNMMNEQLSNFNQIVGVIVGTKLANYYLGHYHKYADHLKDAHGDPVPINNFLSPAEWDEALKWGVVNSLDCGLATDGIKALFDAIDKMPVRPAWTAYFLPGNVKVSKIKKDIEKVERRYFSGEKFEP